MARFLAAAGARPSTGSFLALSPPVRTAAPRTACVLRSEWVGHGQGTLHFALRNTTADCRRPGISRLPHLGLRLPFHRVRRGGGVRNAGTATQAGGGAGVLRDSKTKVQPRSVGNARKDKDLKKGSQPKYTKAARRFYNENFREPQRLGKALAAAGVASRRASEELIFEGRVTVNGNVCKLPQTTVNPLKDVIYVDGNSLPKKMAPKMYFALNKPKGYICSNDTADSKPVLSLFEEYFRIWAQRNPGLPKPRLFTSGRLDVATSGLLIVTNDGEFANKVSHPSSGLTKEYIVTTNSKVSKRQLQTIAEGTLVQDVMCTPVSVAVLEGHSGQRLRIVVSEGRNHEVRHLVENAGLKVEALKRVRVGGLRLSRKLGVGKFEELTESQAKKVLDKNVQAQASQVPPLV